MAADGNIIPFLAMPAHLATRETYELLVSDQRLSETFRKGIRRALNRYETERQAFEGSFGVRWSAMQDEPPELPSLAEIEAVAIAADERARSPRGVFLAALLGIEQVPGHEYDAERLRALYSRDLANADAPLNTKAVGAALAILNEIPGKDARRAIDALAELLLQTNKAAA